MTLNTRTKEAIKTALAMTIAYGIALSMDWDKPMWAGFAVAFISLSTVGQSLNKGALRMTGTLLAAAFSLTLIGPVPPGAVVVLPVPVRVRRLFHLAPT